MRQCKGFLVARVCALGVTGTSIGVTGTSIAVTGTSIGGIGVSVGVIGVSGASAMRAHGQPMPAPLTSFGATPWIRSGSAVSRRLFTSRLGRSNRDQKVAQMIQAGERIARLPYVWGGGHGSFLAAGYDCSGSVSYVLHAGGVLTTPEDSSGLESFGVPGRGRHVTIYANAGHAWMTIDGRRFDTIAFQETGTRWSSTIGSTAGYAVRHPAGL